MLEDIKTKSPKFKDTILFCCWILGILLVGGLLWYFTQDFRENRMLRTINAILIQNSDTRRLQSTLPDDPKSKRIYQNYQRFSLVNSSDRAVIITMYDNTIPSLCAIFIDNNGMVRDILPLDNHSAQVMERMEKTKLDVYIKHIEENEQQIRSGE
ncbi:MAG: hypothetical protein LBV20_01345 [Treponema sp.]|jgi:hypothetical protein|nr:hypothetical protein [Treponema sp.]